MLRNCDVCGTEYLAKRSTSKYCTARCRVRAQRGTEVAPATPPPSKPSAPIYNPIEAATLLELEVVKQENSSLGQMALMAARRLDSITADTASSIAALMREHRATLTAAIEAGQVADDPLDQLAKRRQERRA